MVEDRVKTWRGLSLIPGGQPDQTQIEAGNFWVKFGFFFVGKAKVAGSKNIDSTNAGLNSNKSEMRRDFVQRRETPAHAAGEVPIRARNLGKWVREECLNHFDIPKFSG